MDDPRALKIAVAGGSIGGLAAGIALRGIGAEVDVFEREPGPLQTGGAGIVVQPDLLDLLAHHGAPSLPMTGCSQRRYLTPGGDAARTASARQQFTSWEAIYRTMRAVFPDARYHLDTKVTGYEKSARGVAVEIANHGTIEADLLVAADGAHSATRHALQPQVESRYAGYIAWRGTVPEAEAGQDLLAAFDDCFTFCEARSGGHMLVYLIPGDGADVRVGQRRLNWVWYVAADDDELAASLTDRFGTRHHASLPRGSASETALVSLRRRAEGELAPVMAELVAATAEPFIQKITDIAVERTVFERVMLLGDAAFLVRPHTAAAAAKACFDAARLAAALVDAGNDIDAALAAAERAQLRYGRRLVEQGIALGSDWPARRA
ncbi:MAG: FAD-dependent monooxygenase [Nitrococcus sp.]|nr:FAD-dependent monooxygenase [Nitrococcus sp.]